MKITIEELQEYLFDHYKNGGIDQSLFMKLVEEIGEVAEVLNKKAGRKSVGQEDLQTQLGNELADVVHYTIAIAALNWTDTFFVCNCKQDSKRKPQNISEKCGDKRHI